MTNPMAAYTVPGVPILCRIPCPARFGTVGSGCVPMTLKESAQHTPPLCLGASTLAYESENGDRWQATPSRCVLYLHVRTSSTGAGWHRREVQSGGEAKGSSRARGMSWDGGTPGTAAGAVVPLRVRASIMARLPRVPTCPAVEATPGPPELCPSPIQRHPNP